MPVTADISAAAFIIACICSSVRPIVASCAITCKLCSSPIFDIDCNSLAKLRRLYTLSSLRYGLFLAAVCSAISALRWTWYAFSQSLSASTVFFIDAATAIPAMVVPLTFSFMVFNISPKFLLFFEVFSTDFSAFSATSAVLSSSSLNSFSFFVSFSVSTPKLFNLTLRSFKPSFRPSVSSLVSKRGLKRP